MDFQAYQRQFCASLRDVHLEPPAGSDLRRLAVYQNSVFNNVFDVLANCFRLSKRLLGQRAWQELVRQFLREHSTNTPIFREISQEFLTFLTQKNHLPAHYLQLLHYEWVELALINHHAPDEVRGVNREGNLIHGEVVCNPTLRLLTYDYPVHLISGRQPLKALRHQLQQTTPTYLAAYRKPSFEVGFAELNTLTFLLLQRLQGSGDAQTGEAALRAIAPHALPLCEDDVLKFGSNVLEVLRTEGLVLGTY